MRRLSHWKVQLCVSVITTSYFTRSDSKALVHEGCWNSQITFEQCCVPWDAKDAVSALETKGNPLCWTSGFSYEQCCVPGPVPRDMFMCDDRGEIWQRFRRDMMFGANFAHTDLATLRFADTSTCLLGGLIVALAFLVAASASNKETSFDRTFDFASAILRLVFLSPASLDEVLASGWPLGSILQTLVATPRVRARAARDAGIPPGLSATDFDAVTAVTDLLSDGKRVPSELIASLNKTQDAESTSFSSDQAAAMTAATVTLIEVYNLRSFDIPFTPRRERNAMTVRALELMASAESSLKLALFGVHTSSAHRRESSDANGSAQQARFGVLSKGDDAVLAKIITTQTPLVFVLSALQREAIVMVDPMSIYHDDAHGKSMLPSMLHPRFVLPHMELHVLPAYDALSNAVRTLRRPFCSDPAYLMIIATMACFAPCGRSQRQRGVRKLAWPSTQALSSSHMCCGGQQSDVLSRVALWEIGANLGDCVLWTASMLSGGPDSPAIAHVDAVAYEPFPAAASALRRSAAAFHDRHVGWRDAGHRVSQSSIQVQELAVGDQASATEILGVPHMSFAQSTFHGGCKGSPYCGEVKVKTDTVDRLLDTKTSDFVLKRQGESRRHNSPRGVLDIMKIHVQGAELHVLRGAQKSLSAGRVCLVLLRVSSVGLGPESAESIAAEVRQHLKNYTAVLFDDFGVAKYFSASGVEFAEAVSIARKAQDWKDLRGYASEGQALGATTLVAWHPGSKCKSSYAVAAAESMFKSP
eukprot:TRINITY_DN38467_c0_g1_i1.p1 TRINITY_DN38467_c0_g1~~TRINITY_DN38467_c0_g1_i1.p1  ORF type:complete len:777 (+),score=47.98 TRINITY_DN38467_c0_g1_i1:58-2331(+)